MEKGEKGDWRNISLASVEKSTSDGLPIIYRAKNNCVGEKGNKKRGIEGESRHAITIWIVSAKNDTIKDELGANMIVAC